MAIKIEMLRCFSIVAQTGNLADAAARLGRTQSAVSMTLKQLEAHLGQRLFKSDRKNRLTPFGEQVFEIARAELRQFDEAIHMIETSANTPQGLIRIASVPSVASTVFPKIVKVFSRRYPGINIELRDADSVQVVDALMRGQADIGIASPKHRLNGIRQSHLFSDRFGLICAPNHRLAQQKSTPTIEQVASSNFIHNDLCQTIDTPGFHAATAGTKLSARNTLSLITMVRSGNWVTILPQAVASAAPLEVKFRNISNLSDQRRVSLLLREKTRFRRYVEDMGEVIKQIDWSFVTNTE